MVIFPFAIELGHREAFPEILVSGRRFKANNLGKIYLNTQRGQAILCGNEAVLRLIMPRVPGIAGFQVGSSVVELSER